MQLSLIRKNTINTLVLPKKVIGQFWISYKESENIKKNVINIEGINNKWIIKSNKHFSINIKNEKIKVLEVELHKIYKIIDEYTGEIFFLYSEPVTKDRQLFIKYIIPNNTTISIGRAEDNTIKYDNAFVSSEHAEIVSVNDNFIITDLNSLNGTFVNGEKIKTKELTSGDVIYIFGLKVIIGNGFIAINNPDNMITCKSYLKKLKSLKKLENFEEDIDEFEEKNENNIFFPSPRLKRDIKTVKIKIDPPPQQQNIQETPFILLIGPSITMGMASLFTAVFALSNVLSGYGNIRSVIPTLVMSFSMLLGTVLWPILSKKYEKKKRIERESKRQEKYKKYINDMKNIIEREIHNQEKILHENFITIDECEDRIKNVKRNLWERSSFHNDFLVVRVGTGNISLDAEINYQEKRFNLDEDNLQDYMYSLVEKPHILKEVPITISLIEKYILGIIGEEKLILDFIKGLIIQIVALHSYDEVKLVFILNEENDLEFFKWLPHVFDNNKKIRFVIKNKNEAKEVSSYLEKEFLTRKDNTNLEHINPQYIIISNNKEISEKMEIIKLILKEKENLGFSFISICKELKNLPKECINIIELKENGYIYDRDNIYGQSIEFVLNNPLKSDYKELVLKLANLEIKIDDEKNNLPNMITFLELFDVGKIEHLNVLSRWKENDPTKTLETEIGIDTKGDKFKLDLHEKFHGPHGLVAGMTGSGKSEFIITYILSLAVNYSPYEVAFILIDYKGGGMAESFKLLPHLVGIITNLDGAAINRSLVSIQSELKRRQAIFREVSKKINVSNIDIYKYQALYREGKVDEPLQHLFIISDEFAELKTQQPEFMTQLISAARIGRSLGVHLILATQKPAGVVDEQIWSNSRFRICLKVQEKADSMDVLKRADAAELTNTGRFYLQVGYNEIFDLGQSAWSGAPYEPSDKVLKRKDDNIEVIDGIGRVIKNVAIDKRKKNKSIGKQIDNITSYLSKLAKDEGIKIKPLWLEPLSKNIYVDDLEEKYKENIMYDNKLNPIIGEVDDPENQKQFEMTIPLTEEGNVIVYGVAGSGKSTLINTMVYSLIKHNNPEKLNIYILDFASETSKVFSKAPHLGDIILSHELEKITNMFKMLTEKLEDRRRLCSDFGGDYNSLIENSSEKVPYIVVIIQNYSGFSEMYDQFEEKLNYLTREGTKYGIYFVLTALNTNSVRFRLLQNFKQLLVLQLNDNSDYSVILGNVNGIFPAKIKGRGIFRNEKIYEFQTAYVNKEGSSIEYLRNYCEEYNNSWKGKRAESIPVLPEHIDFEFIKKYIRDDEKAIYPIGIEKASLNISYYSFENYMISFILTKSEKIKFIETLSKVIAYNKKTELKVLDGMNSFAKNKHMDYQLYSSKEEIQDSVIEIFNELVYRNNSYKKAIDSQKSVPVYSKKVCIINGFSEVVSILSNDCQDKLNVLLEKCKVNYNYTFIIVENPDKIGNISYQPWFRQLGTFNNAIWIGSGIAEQYQLKISKVTNNLYEEIEDDFGYLVENGKPLLIKFIN